MPRTSSGHAVLLAFCLSANAALGAIYPPLKPSWQLTCAKGFYAPPTVVGQTVYVADVGGEVRAVSLLDGAVKWTFAAQDSLYSGVAVAGKLGYVGSVDKSLYALDLATGQPAWTAALDGLVYATPVVAAGTVVVGTGDTGSVHAFDAATGAERWTFRLGGRMGSGLAIADGLVYVGSYDHHLYALDLATGQRRWQFAAETVVDSMPLAADGVVYVKLTNDAVCALDARTGQVAWRSTPLLAQVGDEPTSWSPLAKVGDHLLLALSDGRLQALRAATGEQVWVSSLGPVLAAPPVMASELGYVGTKEGALAAVDPQTGETVWQWSAPQPARPGLLSGIMWPPVVAGERLLAASMDGHLYAFDGSSDGAAWHTARPAAGRAAQPGPGRIAVGGLFPVGYVGCLARHGLPRDLLYDAQLADLETLRRYDLLILAGVPEEPAINRAVQQFVEQGGAAIIDYSATRINLPNVPHRSDLLLWTADKSAAPAGFAVKGFSLTPQPLAIASGRLSGIALADGLVGEKSIGYVPEATRLTEVQVLADHPSTVLVRKEVVQVTGGPASPSVVMGRLGQGRVILCGLQVGVKTEYSGLDLQALILALVKQATSGRATPQLVPDTPHVGYNATVASVGGIAAADPIEEEPDLAEPGPPAGPGARAGLPKDCALLEAEPADEYDVLTTIPARGGEVLLHYWNAGNFVRVSVSPSGIAIARCREGRVEPLESVRTTLPAGQPLAIQDRCDTLTVRSGQVYLKTDLTGLHPGVLGQRGMGQGVEYRPTESVYFTDDFMRTDEDPGPWRTFGGQWSTTPEQNTDMGANPFSYKCQAADGVATALSGQEFWDEYRLTCAVRPNSAESEGTVGLGWYAHDADNMYLLQAVVRSDLEPHPHGLRLVRLVNGQPTVLAERAGGVKVGQWYEFRVQAEGPRISAAIDGVTLLRAEDTTFHSGQAALRVEHAAARFDDVVATAAVLPLETGARLLGETPSQAGLIDVDSWASPAMGWEPDPAVSGMFWRRDRFFGDVDLDFAWPSLPDGGEVSLVVDGDGRTLDSGYVLCLKRAGELGRLELRRQGQRLKAADVPIGKRVKLVLRRRAELEKEPSVRLDALLGGRTVVSTVAPPLGRNGRLGFRAVGFLPKIAALTVWAQNLRDYTFDTAPCDWWVASGTWDLTNRWSCVPEWSWFGGFSEQQAAVWGKQQFRGDIVLDYYVGSKMLNAKVPGYQGKDQERTGDFNVTLYGDGHSTDTGYSFTLGPEGAPGEIRTKHGRVSGAGATLRRNGQEVARNDQFRFFSEAHNRWAAIRVEKRGPMVTLSVDGQPVIEYRDPAPLEQGFVAIWTNNNGLLMPRITLAFEQLGQELLSLR